MLKPMIDMAHTPEDIEKEYGNSVLAEPNKPLYPYGLRISLGKDELEKLGVDYSDWKVGETFHLFALAKITSISSNENQEGEDCNVCLQITHLAGESEDEENEEMDEESNEPPLEKHGYIRYNA